MVNSCTAESFESWLAQHGIGEGRDVSGRDFDFSSADEQDHDRYWEYPKQRRGFARYLEVLLDSLDPWSGCYVYYSMLNWGDPQSPSGHAYEWDRNKLASIGVPVGPGEIIIWFDKSDKKLLLKSLLLQMEHCLDCDLIPDHAQQILYLNHHSVVHIVFRDDVRLEEYVRALEAKGVLLPDGPPDWMFKPQPWFRNSGGK
jgi:hypothetical protein